VTQWIFRRHFNIHRNDSVPRRNTVLLWVRNFRETAPDAKRKPPGGEPSLRTRQVFLPDPVPTIAHCGECEQQELMT